MLPYLDSRHGLIPCPYKLVSAMSRLSSLIQTNESKRGYAGVSRGYAFRLISPTGIRLVEYIPPFFTLNTELAFALPFGSRKPYFHHYNRSNSYLRRSVVVSYGSCVGGSGVATLAVGSHTVAVSPTGLIGHISTDTTRFERVSPTTLSHWVTHRHGFRSLSVIDTFP
jgi:hypothetical protein